MRRHIEIRNDLKIKKSLLQYESDNKHFFKIIFQPLLIKEFVSVK